MSEHSGTSGPPAAAVPFPTDPAQLKMMAPLFIQQELRQLYRHSYAELSPFFAGLANGVLLGSRCPACGYAYATPRPFCAECGTETEWLELPQSGCVHTWTICHYGAERFLPETPFVLILVEFEGIDTLFLSRLRDLPPDTIRIGLTVEARFAAPAALDVTDVWFVPA